MPSDTEQSFLENLRRKIVVYAVLYTLAALLLVSFLGILPLFQRLKSSEEESLLQVAQARTLAVDEFLSRLSEISLQISDREFVRIALGDWHRGAISRADLQESIKKNLQGIPLLSEEIVGVSLLDHRGVLVARAGLSIPAHILPSLAARQQEHFISDPLVIRDRLYLLLGAPVYTEEREWVGTGLTLFATHKLQRIVWDPSTLQEGADALLGQMREGRAEIFFPGRLGEIVAYNIAMDDPLYIRAMTEAAQGRAGLVRSERPRRAVADILAHAPVPRTEWGLLVTTDQRKLYAGVNALLISVGGLVLILALCGGGGLFFLLRPLTREALDYSAKLERLNQQLQQENEERSRAEEGLRRSEHEWAQTFEAITDAVAILDAEGNVLKMNRANVSFLSSLSQNVLSERRCKVHFGLEESERICPFTQMKLSGKPEHGELYEPGKDRYYHISIYPLLSEDGTLWGGVHIAQDITEQKKMESLKDEMISSVSHEMRTPLTAMLGFVEFLLEQEVEPQQQREFLETVHRETERLNDLVSNFLDLQRLQAQLETYQFEPLPACPLVQEAVHLFAVASKKHPIRLECPPQLPTVWGDSRRLQQVLKNLLSNAIRYSPEGGAITVGAEEDEGSVRFWVRDEGMGIPPLALNRIFDRFYRVDDSARRIPGGIGLGLALVREVVRAHKGRVWVESTMGRGSTFYFTVPVTGEEAAKG
jgi:signal transduction histidine kinase